MTKIFNKKGVNDIFTIVRYKLPKQLYRLYAQALHKFHIIGHEDISLPLYVAVIYAVIAFCLLVLFFLIISF